MWIVTGGAGLIGSAVVWYWNTQGITDILIVDHLGESEKWKNLRALRYSDYLEKDDFLPRLARGDFDGKIEGIMHLGACSATTELDATYLINNNFRYTAELAEYAVRNNIRMVYASSCATYGDGTLGYKDDESAIEELRPLNMYGYSKQMFDLYAKQRGWLDKLVGCKFSNVYGPNEFHKGNMRSVVLRAFEQITATGKMGLFKSYNPEYADGEFKRDFLYVKDAVKMLWHLACVNKDAHGLFNIGSGRAETWNALAEAAFSALGKPCNIEYIEMPEHLRSKYQYYTCAEMDKLRAAGYTQEATSLKDAVHDYLVNYCLQGKYLGD